MPTIGDALAYVESPSTNEDELRRACAILQLPAHGGADALRTRLDGHLATLDARRPVVCLNPGPLPPRAVSAGPGLPRPGADEYAASFAAEIALVPDAPDFAAMLAEQVDVTRALDTTFGEAHADVRYAPGK